MSPQADGIHHLESILTSPAIIEPFVMVYAYHMTVKFINYLCLETFLAVASAHEPLVSGNILKNVNATTTKKEPQFENRVFSFKFSRIAFAKALHLTFAVSVFKYIIPNNKTKIHLLLSGQILMVTVSYKHKDFCRFVS